MDEDRSGKKFFGAIIGLIVLVGLFYLGVVFKLRLPSGSESESPTDAIVKEVLSATAAYSLSGKITATGPNSMRVDVPQILTTVIPEASSLRIREVTFSDSTKFFEQTRKDPRELNEELSHYNPKSGNPPPYPILVREISKGDFKVGDNVLIEASDADIKLLPVITASRITKIR